MSLTNFCDELAVNAIRRARQKIFTIISVDSLLYSYAKVKLGLRDKIEHYAPYAQFDIVREGRFMIIKFFDKVPRFDHKYRYLQDSKNFILTPRLIIKKCTSEILASFTVFRKEGLLNEMLVTDLDEEKFQVMFPEFSTVLSFTAHEKGVIIK